LALNVDYISLIGFGINKISKKYRRYY